MKFWATMLIIPIFTWYIAFAAIDRNFDMEQQYVAETVQKYTQTAAKKGIMYEALFKEMMKKINLYGDFEVYILAERFDGNNPPVKLEGYQVINTDLRAQNYDLLTVVVVANKRHPVSVFYDFSVFGTKTGSRYDIKLAGRACSYIK